jgi:hypothetical protein
MPKTRSHHAVRLEFAPGSLVHANLSGAAFTGTDWLWVAGDEACGVDRLKRLPSVAGEALRFGEVQDFPLAELLDLPGAADEEADLEGMAFHDGWLWVVGSHGLKRRNARPDKTDAENARRLRKVSLDANRRLLACLPVQTAADGTPALVRSSADGRRAMRLKGDAQDNEITALLRDDPHFGPYLAIPGKDNGFDIEGLALLDEGKTPAAGQRLLLGLRGPVLRGWAALLELRVQPRGDMLRLAPLDDAGTRLRKHFLPLAGLGVRDLQFHGEDLYILAGPTMVLDGDIRVLRWSGALAALRDNTGAERFWPAPEQALALPHGPGTDRAEALCEVPAALAGGRSAWLVLYDAPGPARRDGEFTVLGDLLRRA